MGTLRVLLFLAGFFVIAYGVGRYWKLKPETAQDHVVHSGEVAELAPSGMASVWVAVDGADSYQLQKAMVAKDERFLRDATARNAAFPVAPGTRVKVFRQSSENRRIQILDGPATGRFGWVEFEYLRIPKPGER